MDVVRCMGSMTRAVGVLGSVDEPQNGSARGHGRRQNGNGELRVSGVILSYSSVYVAVSIVIADELHRTLHGDAERLKR